MAAKQKPRKLSWPAKIFFFLGLIKKYFSSGRSVSQCTLIYGVQINHKVRVNEKEITVIVVQRKRKKERIRALLPLTGIIFTLEEPGNAGERFGKRKVAIACHPDDRLFLFCFFSVVGSFICPPSHRSLLVHQFICSFFTTF